MKLRTEFEGLEDELERFRISIQRRNVKLGLDYYTKTETDALNWAWGDITSGVPTTISGYGITDAYTKTETDSLIDAYVKVEISSAEILDINSNPKILVAAPGAGKILIPFLAIAKYVYDTAPYATNTAVVLRLDTGGTIITFSNLINQAANKNRFTGVGTLSGDQPENKKIELSVSTGDPTAGSGTLTIYLWYKIVTL